LNIACPVKEPFDQVRARYRCGRSAGTLLLQARRPGELNTAMAVMRRAGRASEMSRQDHWCPRPRNLAGQTSSRPIHILTIVVGETGSVPEHAHDGDIDRLQRQARRTANP
jgi:hypothetical protein